MLGAVGGGFANIQPDFCMGIRIGDRGNTRNNGAITIQIGIGELCLIAVVEKI